MSLNRLRQKATGRLLSDWAAIQAELHRRRVVRTANNPVADYAEHLVARALRLSLVPSSTAGYDALNARGTRYEIKARRITSKGKATMFGTIRRLREKRFDHLVAVVFEEDFQVAWARLIPREIVVKHATYRPHINGWVLLLKDVKAAAGSTNLTNRVREAQDSGA